MLLGITSYGGFIFSDHINDKLADPLISEVQMTPNRHQNLYLYYLN